MAEKMVNNEEERDEALQDESLYEGSMQEETHGKSLHVVGTSDEELLEEIPDEELLYDLADLFRVFGDTTRIKILYSLMGCERCVADIADVISCTQSAVSHQLRILKQARLVRFRREGRNLVYALSDDHVYTVLAQGLTHICE